MAARTLIILALSLLPLTASADAEDPPRHGDRWGALTSGFTLLALAANGERKRRRPAG